MAEILVAQRCTRTFLRTKVLGHFMQLKVAPKNFWKPKVHVVRKRSYIFMPFLSCCVCLSSFSLLTFLYLSSTHYRPRSSAIDTAGNRISDQYWSPQIPFQISGTGDQYSVPVYSSPYWEWGRSRFNVIIKPLVLHNLFLSLIPSRSRSTTHKMKAIGSRIGVLLKTCYPLSTGGECSKSDFTH